MIKIKLTDEDKLKYIEMFILDRTGLAYRMSNYTNKQQVDLFANLNPGLTHGDLSMKDKIALVDEYIMTKPTWTADVFRGVNIDQDELDEQLKDGDDISMGGLASWTSLLDVAEHYSHGDKLNVIYVLDNNVSGISVAPLSMFYQEREILPLSTATYKLNKVEDVVKDGITYKYIHLDEIGDDGDV